MGLALGFGFGFGLGLGLVLGLGLGLTSVRADHAREHREWARGVRRQRVHLRRAATGRVNTGTHGTEGRQSTGAAMLTRQCTTKPPPAQHLRHRVVSLGLRLLRLQLCARLPRKVCVS